MTLRMRGVFFALATVAVSLAMVQISRHFVDLTGGADGLALKFYRQLAVGDAVAHAGAVPLCVACLRRRLLLDHALAS